MNIALALVKKEEDDENKDDGLAEPSEESGIIDDNDVDSPDRKPVSDESTNDTEDEEVKVRNDSSHTISFRKPEGATLSFDGRVIGDVPCEITKVTGEHEITLKMDGYETQNYTVDIADDGEDVVYSFPEMVRE